MQVVKQGKSTGKSDKWQCKECGKYTNVLPSRGKSYNYHQKKNVILPLFAELLLNRMPVKRTCEILGIGVNTYYSKLEILYQRCLEFLERYEAKPLTTMSFDEMWIDSDYLQYNLNNVRKKGCGGKNYDNLDEKQLQTYILVSGNPTTRYIFRADIAYDWDITLEDIKNDTILFKDDALYRYARKNGRFDLSAYPMRHTSDDIDDFIETENKLNKRKLYADGLNVTSTYTAMAHHWLLKQTLNVKDWWFVTDDDDTLMKAIFSVYANKFEYGYAHHFVCNIDGEKTIRASYTEAINPTSR